MYDVHCGLYTVADLAADIPPDGRRLFVWWVRHHWVVAEFLRGTATADRLVIYDSAASSCVARDIGRIARQAGWPAPEFFALPQQHRNSNECGVFAIAVVLLRAHGIPIRTGASDQRLSLCHLREACAAAAATHDTSVLSTLAMQALGSNALPTKQQELASNRPLNDAQELSQIAGGAAGRPNTRSGADTEPPSALFLQWRAHATAALEAARTNANAAASRNLCFALVGAALEAAMLQAKPILDVRVLAPRVATLGFPASTQQSIADYLVARHWPIFHLISQGDTFTWITPPPSSAVAIFAETAYGTTPPRRLATWHFLLAAQFTGTVTARGQLGGGHYDLVDTPSPRTTLSLYVCDPLRQPPPSTAVPQPPVTRPTSHKSKRLRAACVTENGTSAPVNAARPSTAAYTSAPRAAPAVPVYINVDTPPTPRAYIDVDATASDTEPDKHFSISDTTTVSHTQTTSPAQDRATQQVASHGSPTPHSSQALHPDTPHSTPWCPAHTTAIEDRTARRLQVGDIIATQWYDPSIRAPANRERWWYGRIAAAPTAVGTPFTVHYLLGSKAGSPIRHLCRDHAAVVGSWPDPDVIVRRLERLPAFPLVGSPSPDPIHSRQADTAAPALPPRQRTAPAEPCAIRTHDPYLQQTKPTDAATLSAHRHALTHADTLPCDKSASHNAPALNIANKSSREWGLTSHAALTATMRTIEGRKDRWLSVCIMHDAARRDGDDHDAAITVIGSVVKSNHDYLLHVTLDKCRQCGCWSSHLDADTTELTLPMPVPQCSYFGARVIHSLPETSCACIDDDDLPTQQLTTNDEFKREMAPDASLGWTGPDSLRGEICARWFIHDGKPAHVHSISWKQLHASTRATHVKWLRVLKEMPRDYHQAPLGTAAIQMVLRAAEDNHWSSWGTVASALSHVASALRHLPEYTSNRQAIDLLKIDPQFASASRRAQHLARVTKQHTSQAALTPEQYATSLASCKHPVVRLFIELCWAFAGRVGDIRQVRGNDVVFGSQTDTRQTIHITFRRGKGAAFWGPYTIAANVSLACSKALADHIRSRGKITDLFTGPEQRSLSEYIRATGVSDVRSIRRGRLQHLASCGATTEQLRLLSGHRREDTLLRYLGWGLFSANSRSAAVARDATEAAVIGGEGPPAPRRMGMHSGYCGQKGQRVRAPPHPFRAPKAVDLGISSSNVQDWELKAKNIATLDWNKVVAQLGSCNTTRSDSSLGFDLLQTDDWHTIRAKLDSCIRWCSAAPMIESGMVEDPAATIPASKIRRCDFDVLLASEKITPLEEDEEVKGWATGYLIPQEKKRQRRPVWEPHLNRWELPEQPQATYPARRTRRYLRYHRYCVDFDFRQYFDQFGLTKEAQSYYCCRYRITESDGSISSCIVKLTRLPMGVSFAPAVAQMLTDVITAPLLRMTDIKLFTMIDNVRIAAKDAAGIRKAVDLFINRCRAVDLALNPLEDVDGTPIELDPRSASAQELAEWALSPKIFLGELIDSRTARIKNAPKNTEKMLKAWDRLLLAQLPTMRGLRRGHADPASHTRPTYRHIVSLISLLLFLIHTHDIHLSSCHDLLRPYSKLATTAALVGWDTPIEYLDDRLRSTLQGYVTRILELDTQWSALPIQPAPPSVQDKDYDVIITSDACREGWAAFVHRAQQDELILLKQRWAARTHTRFDLSTVAEPVALSRALLWVQQQPWYHDSIRIACVSDHAAITTGQRKWWSHNGGFSMNPYLNSCFAEMNKVNAVAFFIPGEVNPADAPSRATTLGSHGASITATTTRCQLSLTPTLALLDFPFATEDSDTLTGAEIPRMMG